jgi:hypothetical protein
MSSEDKKDAFICVACVAFALLLYCLVYIKI